MYMFHSISILNRIRNLFCTKLYVNYKITSMYVCPLLCLCHTGFNNIITAHRKLVYKFSIILKESGNENSDNKSLN